MSNFIIDIQCFTILSNMLILIQNVPVFSSLASEINRCLDLGNAPQREFVQKLKIRL